MFEIKQFSSGEYEVRVTERLTDNPIQIHWNWFDKSQRDFMQLLLKIDAVKTNYPHSRIEVHAPYLPYLRQDRIFEAGQGIPANIILDLFDKLNVGIITYAPHSHHDGLMWAEKYNLRKLVGNYNIIFPDKNAKHHYYGVESYFSFSKIRNDDGVQLTLDHTPHKIHTEHTFLICDDICAGGRTFIECANALRQQWGDNIKIELMIYHAFLDHGIKKIRESGISKVHVINPDSYAYILDLYPNNHEYFFNFVQI
jgi:ribose-phosphate pyrophosphokinase